MLQASALYSDLEVADADALDLTEDGTSIELTRGTTVYIPITTLSETFADHSDDDVDSLAESCVLSGNPLRQGRAEIVGYVSPFENSDDEWNCGVVLTITEDAAADEVLIF